MTRMRDAAFVLNFIAPSDPGFNPLTMPGSLLPKSA
jgi:hypothetical protein